jgi:hypothetical protein
VEQAQRYDLGKTEMGGAGALEHKQISSETPRLASRVRKYFECATKHSTISRTVGKKRNPISCQMCKLKSRESTEATKEAQTVEKALIKHHLQGWQAKIGGGAGNRGGAVFCTK